MMRPALACLLLSLVLLSTQVIAQDALLVGTSDQSEKAHRARVRLLMRAAVTESFSYDGTARAETNPPVAADVPTRAAQTDPDVVVLDTFEVRTRAFDRDLPSAIKKWRPSGPQNNTRFGTGVREKDFGKVRASVVTILYIPVLVGFSW